MKNVVFLLVISLSFCCCTRSNLESVLSQAGENRIELEKVLEHYKKNPKDKLKLKAAKYLIEHLDAHYFYQSEELDKYCSALDSIFRLNSPDAPLTALQDSLLKALNYSADPTRKIVPDLKVISADFLISNIDDAFEVWQSPFAKDMSFDDFCEYLLPYRTGREKIENWRLPYQSTFAPLLQTDLDTACQLKDGLLMNDEWELYSIPAERTHKKLSDSIFANVAEFTVCGWIKPADTNKTYSRFFDFGKGESSYICFIPYDNNRKSSLRFRTSEAHEIQLEVDSLPVGQWSHVTVLLKKQQVSLYINGKRTGSKMVNTNLNLKEYVRNYVGKSQYPQDPYFEGEVNRFRVYNRALADKEIGNLAAERTAEPDVRHGVVYTTDFKSPSYHEEEYRLLSRDLFSGVTDFTVCGWVELADSSRAYARFFDFGKDESYYICFVPSDGIFSSLRIRDEQAENIIWGDALPANQRSHVAVTLSGDYICLYINGRLANTRKIAMDPSRFVRNYIGKSQYVYDPALNGKINDFRFYGRALNYKEISALAGKDNSSSTANLQAVVDRVKTYYHRVLLHDGYVPNTGYDPSLLLNLKIGSCNDYSLLGAHILRSVGIPAAIDFSLQAGHDWNAIVFDEKNYDFSFLDDNKDSVGVHVVKYVEMMNDRVAKIFRHTYAKQKDVPVMSGSKEDYPNAFRNPCIKDVTDLYLACSDITVKIENAPPHNQTYMYLCNFQREWLPVYWSKHNTRKAKFTKMGRGVVYMPAYYNSGKLHPAAYPYLLDSTGHTRVLKPDMEKMQKLSVLRKFPEKDGHQNDRLIGAKFQVAQQADFSDSITIYTVTGRPAIRYNEVKPALNEKYRYFRYLAPPGFWGSEICEMDVFDGENKKIVGAEVLGNRDCWEGRGPESVFDGDPLTSYWCHQKDNGWVGLDFGRPVDIASFRFLPLNADNFIREDELYELFYWDNDWISLGQQTGTSTQTLEYENVPGNVLFWLRNLTKGKEERIFTYEEGKQVWW